MRPLRTSLALLALAAPAGLARADAVPKLDVERTCQSAAKASVSDNASYDGCLRSEREARREAERRWGDFTPAAKRQCESQFKAGGYPSYVEMVTCLELASGTVPTQPRGPGASTGDTAGEARRARDTAPSRLTQEPSPDQRTNPIEVLGKK